MSPRVPTRCLETLVHWRDLLCRGCEDGVLVHLLCHKRSSASCKKFAALQPCGRWKGQRRSWDQEAQGAQTSVVGKPYLSVEMDQACCGHLLYVCARVCLRGAITIAGATVAHAGMSIHTNAAGSRTCRRSDGDGCNQQVDKAHVCGPSPSDLHRPGMHSYTYKTAPSRPKSETRSRFRSYF
jgi:hypothetical protein